LKPHPDLDTASQDHSIAKCLEWLRQCCHEGVKVRTKYLLGTLSKAMLAHQLSHACAEGKTWALRTAGDQWSQGTW